ncbi:hypothetical protein THERMOT_1288 [Bathymodiolus thermophilus thioautotrophic gill symbiont]|uniref:RHS repeat-associated core domain-containing protein n=1 Tax=Bathymodiolus thermophilus thioautotrophic gill symbiont TaxID=2360 RepID=UPI00192C07D9|nr:RHS repeat-associated core domain-containing protein [Bathymodiolus thermophilus thioautotrophic gill symbiont]CAB5500678.1 hypothetical protein THERMOT_1288 [Bathymodiolus thermophilus thioautotrophic gill symbiont]
MSRTYLRGTHDNANTLTSNTTNDDSGIGRNSKATFTVNTSNVYYTSAGSHGNNIGTYTLTVTGSNTAITTTYIGKLYEQIKQNTNTEHKHFIYADGQLIAINIKTNTTANTPSIPDKTRYLHYDNLGSIDNIVGRMAYTAFGQRRQGDWRANNPLLPIIPTLTNRGFTGHEHIDEMGFIHMNGRVYDPSIGQFLSADPNIQAPYNTQSYNRYSYVLNNPLKYTDPSGFFLRKMFELSDKISKRFSPIGYAIQRSIEKAMMKNPTLRAIGMIAASAFGGPAGAAAFSARMAYLSGGNDGDIFKAAAVSFASASAAGYIGHGGVDGAPIVEGAINKAIAHGLAQGAISQISGGNFQDGFVGGFIGSVAGSNMSEGGDWSDIAGRTAIAATAGGITAELGGGKFSNGARSAAFVHLFNSELSTISLLTAGSLESNRVERLSLNEFKDEFSSLGYEQGFDFESDRLHLENDVRVKILSGSIKEISGNSYAKSLTADMTGGIFSKVSIFLGISNIFNILSAPNFRDYQFHYSYPNGSCQLDNYSIKQ